VLGCSGKLETWGLKRENDFGCARETSDGSLQDKIETSLCASDKDGEQETDILPPLP
jgi:hypothetical protein